ncbi:hypothetical protein GCM10020358_59810 [Amorphoplanes nipponensis]|nr:hypothetical protein [Actinoplanes nipponensis]
MPFNYDGKTFVSPGDALTGHYRQHGNLVWGEITGGAVRRGALAGICDPDGVIRFAYHEVLADGSVVVGECVSRPERLPDGRIRLREEWVRHGPHRDSGISVIEEAVRDV